MIIMLAVLGFIISCLTLLYTLAQLWPHRDEECLNGWDWMGGGVPPLCWYCQIKRKWSRK